MIESFERLPTVDRRTFLQTAAVAALGIREMLSKTLLSPEEQKETLKCNVPYDPLGYCSQKTDHDHHRIATKRGTAPFLGQSTVRLWKEPPTPEFVQKVMQLSQRELTPGQARLLGLMDIAARSNLAASTTEPFRRFGSSEDDIQELDIGQFKPSSDGSKTVLIPKHHFTIDFNGRMHHVQVGDGTNELPFAEHFLWAKENLPGIAGRSWGYESKDLSVKASMT